jgi:hypothetical protein
LAILRTARAKFPQLTFAFLGLALAVFAWGLQYKLSLYDAPAALSHKMVEAKLLSQNEVSKESERVLVDRSKPASKLFQRLPLGIWTLISLCVLICRPVARLRQLVAAAWLPRQFAAFSAFFFRPPPVRS